MKCIELVIKGKVQGVFFRKHTKDKARQHGVKGFVQNKDDGSVYIIACGEDESIENFSKWCHQGPDAAKVVSIEKQDIPVEMHNEFVIKKDRN